MAEPSDRTTLQVHCNYMLYMRRMMKEISFIMRLQDVRYSITSEEATRVCDHMGFDQARIEGCLVQLLELVTRAPAATPE